MAIVGYYSMTLGQGSSVQENEINDSGDTAVNVTVPNAAQLAPLDTLYVVNPSNGGFGSEYLANLSNISDAVNDGMNLVIFDRAVTNAETILPGGGSITIVRDLGRDIDIATGAPTTFTNGANGTITDTTFDGGFYSNHGYAELSTLPPGAVPLLTTENDNEIVAFTYPVGDGTVFYSTIPLDFYSGSNNNAITPAEVLSLFTNVQDTVCFARGTLIATPTGQTAIEDLRAGDLVCVAAGDPQPVRWIKGSGVSAAALLAAPNLRPVRITAGALGCGMPHRDLLVSRQHRVRVSSKIAERMFGKSDVLIAAIKLTEMPGIYIDNSIETVEYFHCMFDQHQVIWSEGAPTESLFTGPQALASIPRAARKELETLFPELTDPDYVAQAALPIPSGAAQKKMIARHQKNAKPLIG